MVLTLARPRAARSDATRSCAADRPTMTRDIPPETRGPMGSVIKKRRKKIRKHKYKKLLKRMRHRK
jgi:hypothetical protein